MLSRAVASVFFEEHRPPKLPIYGLYAGVARDSCLPCKRYCRAASRAAACRTPVALLVSSRVNVPLETPGCIISAVVTDDPVTKHQAMSIHGVDLEWITFKHVNIGNFTFTGLNVLILSTAQLSVKRTPHCDSRCPWVKAPDHQAFTVLT